VWRIIPLTNSRYFLKNINHLLIEVKHCRSVCIKNWICVCNIEGFSPSIPSQDHPCKNFGGQDGTGNGLNPTISVFACQFHSTNAP
jgi:hypothetical protein